MRKLLICWPSFHGNLGVVWKYFPRKEEQWWDYKISLQEGMMNICTLFGKEEQVEYMDSIEKEEQVKDMNPPRTKGEQVDNTDPPRKGRTLIRLTSMMGWVWFSSMKEAKCIWICWQGMTFTCGWQYGMKEKNTLFLRVVLTKDNPTDVTHTWRVPTFICGYHRIKLA